VLWVGIKRLAFPPSATCVGPFSSHESIESDRSHHPPHETNSCRPRPPPPRECGTPPPCSLAPEELSRLSANRNTLYSTLMRKGECKGKGGAKGDHEGAAAHSRRGGQR
jgi:hypothetical protein